MNKIALNLLKIADALDDLGLYSLAEQTTEVAEKLLFEADMTPVPSKQPQIQQEPVVLSSEEKEAEKEFVKDKGKKKKNNQKGIVEGEDFILYKKQKKT